MTTKITLNNIADTALATLTGPKVTTIVYPGTETATDVAGGATINLTGAGFQSGCSVLVASTASSVVTFISSTQVSFIAPALSAGTYVIYVINPDGGTAISIPGISYSGTPNWTTTAGSLGSAYETGAISSTLTATGDAPITYTVASGTLPTGSSLASNGTLSGTAPVTASATTYTFTVTAKDAQNQTTNRSFSLTINPDVVTWSSPADNTTYTVAKDTAISNVNMSATSAVGGSITYTADTLPTGLSITGANIAGTPTLSANTTTVLTARSSTTRTATKTINWVVNVSNDTYFKYNTLLLQGASTSFVKDLSTNNFVVTLNGDTKPNSFNPYTPGYYSNYFAANEQLTSATIGTSVGTGDFSMECWVNVPTASNTYAAAIQLNVSTGFNLYIQTHSNTLRVLDYNNPTGSNFVLTGGTINSNTWYHLLLTRQSGTIRGFINGNLTVNQTGVTYNYGTAGTCQINAGLFAGNISNVRVILGNVPVAYQTSSTTNGTQVFTPSTTPLTAVTGTILLTSQSNRFIDNSSNAFTFTLTGSPKIQSFNPFTPNTSYSTYGSAYFDGSGDYLNIATSSAFNLTGNFTIEFWFYDDGSSLLYPTMIGNTTGWSAGSFSFRYNNTGQANKISIHWNGATPADPFISSSSTFTTKTWHHAAFTRSGSTCTLWIDGTSQGTGTYATALNLSYGGMNIGWSAWDTTNGYFKGYISDVRVNNGTAVYTTAFTPPSQPLTAIANTSLLTLQNNQSVNNSTFLDNSSNNLLVTRAGNTTQGTFSPYGGNYSNYFDGTGDNLSLATATALGTGNTTVEFWFYPTDSSATYRAMYDSRSTVSTDTGYAIFQYGLTIEVYGNGLKVATSASAFTVNNWVYVALVRTSGTCQLYINGVASGSSGTYSANLTSTVRKIGDSVNTLFPFVGYISNLREVTSALYSGTFTPSTTPLASITNTSLLTCQSNRLIDNSINNYTITKNGDTSVQRFSPFNPASITPTSYSGYFDGTGDFLVTPANAALTFGTGDLTIECWIYQTATSVSTYRVIFGDNVYGSAGGYTLYSYNNALNLWKGGSPAVELIAPAGTITLNVWNHIAWTRSGSSNRLFINGTQVGSTTSDATNYTSTTSYIGASQAGTLPFAGYISNVRIVKGTAVYTSAFTPSTTPLTAISGTSLLTLQSTTFIDNSTNNFTITAYGDSKPTIQNPFGYTSATTTGYSVSTVGGSAYFDGSGDYLTVPSNAAFGFGTSDFTIEGWFYFTGTISTYQRPWWFGDDNDNLEINTSVFRYGGASLTVITGSTALANTWYHIAYSRQSGSGKLFINGTQVGSTTASSYSSSARTVTLMATSSGANPSTGYVSDFRITKGTALYTSNFAVPPTPLTPTGNTSLLLNMTSAGIIDNTMINNLETVGDAKLSTAVSKFGGSSMYFDGTGDYMLTAGSQSTEFGAGDFTIEMWWYPTSTARQALYHGSFGTDWSIGIDYSSVSTNQKIGIWASSNGTSWNLLNADGGGNGIGTTTLTQNAWNHIAFVRSGTSWMLFVNGNRDVNVTGLSGTIVSRPTAQRAIGSWYTSSALSLVNGYIDDLRITKGYARYTSNFTAPTSEFKTF